MRLSLFENWQNAKKLAKDLNIEQTRVEGLKTIITAGVNQSQGQTRLRSYGEAAAVWYWSENIEEDHIKDIINRLFNLGIGYTGIKGLTFNQAFKMVKDLEKRKELEKKTIPGLVFIGETTDGVDQYIIHRVDQYETVLKVGSPAWCLKTKSHWNDYSRLGDIYVISRQGIDLAVPDSMPSNASYESPNMQWRWGITMSKDLTIHHIQDDNNKEVPRSYWTYNNQKMGIAVLINNFLKLSRAAIQKEFGEPIKWKGWGNSEYQAELMNSDTIKITNIETEFYTIVNFTPITSPTITTFTMLEWVKKDEEYLINQVLTCINGDLNRIKAWFKIHGVKLEINAVSSNDIIVPLTSQGRVDGGVNYKCIIPDPTRLAFENVESDIVVNVVDYGNIVDVKVETQLDIDIPGKTIINSLMIHISEKIGKKILVTWADYDKAVIISFITNDKGVLFLIFKGNNVYLEDFDTISEDRTEIEKILEERTPGFKQIKTVFGDIWDNAAESAKAGKMLE